jgi:uncharacterized protein YcbX
MVGLMNPTVSELSATAIKGFGLQHPPRLLLGHAGPPGNRDFFLVDTDDRLVSVTATGCFLPYWSTFAPDPGVLTIGRGEEVVHSAEVGTGAPLRAHFFGSRYADGTLVDRQWDRLLSEISGRDLRLVRTAEPSAGYDVHPVTLMARASATALGRELDGSALDGRRFRMTVTVDGLEAFAEDRWSGSQVRLGGCVLRVGGPVSRCVAVHRRPADGRKDLHTLRMINQVRGVGPSEFGSTLNLGVYGEVLQPGWVKVGDRITASCG